MGSATLPRLFQGLFDRPAPGYLPGVTLDRALQNLKPEFAVSSGNSRAAVLATIGPDIAVEIRERVERHVMMHIVSVEVLLAVPGMPVAEATLKVRNTGLLFRNGIACPVKASSQEAVRLVAVRLEADPELSNALSVLDFRRCEITGSAEGWRILLEPYGGSEVVNRMPSFRRYIRIGPQQVKALATALRAFRRILSKP